MQGGMGENVVFANAGGWDEGAETVVKVDG